MQHMRNGGRVQWLAHWDGILENRVRVPLLCDGVPDFSPGLFPITVRQG